MHDLPRLLRASIWSGVAAVSLHGCASESRLASKYDVPAARPELLVPEAVTAFTEAATPRSYEIRETPKAPRHQFASTFRPAKSPLPAQPAASASPLPPLKSSVAAASTPAAAEQPGCSPQTVDFSRRITAARVTSPSRSVSPAADVRTNGVSAREIALTAGVAVQPAPAAEPTPDPFTAEPQAEPLTPENAPLNTVWMEPLDEYPLDLGTALALVAGQNPQVGFARWRIEEAYAQLDQAEVLWLPSLQFGVSYHRHDGMLQDVAGGMVDINRSSLQAGFGAGAVGAGSTPVPGLQARFHLVDAIFQPKIAERTAWARGHAANAVLHDQMLEASLAYVELLEAAQSLAIAQSTLDNISSLAHLTAEFAATGQGLRSDADRMQTELALRRNDVTQAEERMALASSRLAQAISLNATCRIVPVETVVIPIELVAADCSRRDLIATGLSARPELHESRCLVAEACERLRREQYAPLVPSVLLGLSYDGFGGGNGSTISRFNDRADFDAMAYWEIRNLGFGEQNARNVAGARIEQARFQQVRLMDQVAREVSDAQVQLQSSANQIAIAQEAIEAAEQSFDRNLARIENGQGLPIEALQSIQALDAARREYLSAVTTYNAAQFRLQRALGWPVRGN